MKDAGGAAMIGGRASQEPGMEEWRETKRMDHDNRIKTGRRAGTGMGRRSASGRVGQWLLCLALSAALWPWYPASAAVLGKATVSAGGGHSLVLTSDQTVWAWGDNTNGQLGDGTTTGRQTPTPAQGLSSVAQVSAGESHSLALMSDGRVFAWGKNSSGQLGNNSTVDSNVPVQVQGLPTNVTAVAAGGNHSLALTSDGRIYAWGSNSSGQLGDGTTNNATAAEPVAGLLIGLNPVAVSAGKDHSLALMQDGTVYAWGGNSYGQLGNGTTTASKVPVQVTGLANVAAVSAGGYDSLALTSDGYVYAWGLNSSGQLGDGTTANRNTPVRVFNVLSTGALLTDLQLSDGSNNPIALIPGFTSTTMDYTATVGAGVNQVLLYAKPATSGVTMTLTVNSQSPVSLAVGVKQSVALSPDPTNTLKITVIQGSVISTYTITVNRAKSSNANLSGVDVSPGSLNPVFDPNVLTYTVQGAGQASSLTVTPHLADKSATVTVNGTPTGDGQAVTVPLNQGGNLIPIVVTAQDGAQKQYTLSVNGTVSNADLGSLTVSPGTLSPAFSATTTAYTVNVGNEVDHVDVTASPSDPKAMMLWNGSVWKAGQVQTVNLNVGSNTFAFQVIAQDGTTKTYTVTVIRAKSSNANLNGLDVSVGTLNPSFNPNTLSYTVQGAGSIDSLTVTPHLADPTATVTVNSQPVQDGKPFTVSLNQGPNTISIEVTSPDGTTQKVYTLSVNGTVTNADLQSLTVTPGTLSPTFSGTTTAYTVNVGNAVDRVDVTAVSLKTGVSMLLNGSSLVSGQAQTVNLNIGSNVLSIQVVAPGGGTKTYTVTVYRAPSTNADLGSLTVSAGTLNPAFSATTTAYTVDVGNGANQVTLGVAAAVPGTVTVNGQTVSGGSWTSPTLQVGANVITIVVTAQDGTTTKTYTVT
ncbi:cadherin-like beta sandwich domain-containing protein, partial [Kyrpidia sp.]|uniref:cadherin-like beta sandwich domain-containing protein n=1 Tax=Kyrpidia sp. TaxID=2073077 RepID=UPI00258F21EF